MDFCYDTCKMVSGGLMGQMEYKTLVNHVCRPS